MSERLTACRQCKHRLLPEQTRCPECFRLALPVYPHGQRRRRLADRFDYHGPNVPPWVLLLILVIGLVLMSELTMNLSALIAEREAMQ